MGRLVLHDQRTTDGGKLQKKLTQWGMKTGTTRQTTIDEWSDGKCPV